MLAIAMGFAALFALLLAAAPSPAPAACVLREGGALTFDDKGAKEGELLPDLSMYSLDGKAVSFSQAWGGVLVGHCLAAGGERGAGGLNECMRT